MSQQNGLSALTVSWMFFDWKWIFFVQRSTAHILLKRQQQALGNGTATSTTEQRSYKYLYHEYLMKYATKVLYTCGPYGNFMDADGFLYEELISRCR